MFFDFFPGLRQLSQQTFEVIFSKGGVLKGYLMNCNVSTVVGIS